MRHSKSTRSEDGAAAPFHRISNIYYDFETTDREDKVSQIGSIWSQTNRMRKKNKTFEKRQIRNLNKIVKTFKGLGQDADEEIYWGKREQ